MKDIIKIDCKYHLPCGRCDKTDKLCSLLQPDFTVTTKPDNTVSTVPDKYTVSSSFYIPVNNNGTEPK